MSLNSDECTRCGEKGAYVGAVFVECPNPKCALFSERAREDRLERSLERLQKKLEEEKTDPDITPIYPWGLDIFSTSETD